MDLESVVVLTIVLVGKCRQGTSLKSCTGAHLNYILKSFFFQSLPQKYNKFYIANCNSFVAAYVTDDNFYTRPDTFFTDLSIILTHKPATV